jgi:hypothetical protein
MNGQEVGEHCMMRGENEMGRVCSTNCEEMSAYRILVVKPE